jgi:flagellar export protein FliJ
MNRHLRLRIVLRLREMEEETARVELATAIEAHRGALKGRDEAGALLSERATDLAEVQVRGGTSDGLIAAARALLTAGAIRERADEAVERAAVLLMDRRGRLADASRRRDAVERLRDRILAEQRMESDRREGAEASEMATTRHVWLAVMDADR